MHFSQDEDMPLGGETMNIQYFAPLSRGIKRTRKMLFHPLELHKWFTIGFTAFLAGLANVGFPTGYGFNIGKRSQANLEQIMYFPQRAWEWLGNHPGWAIAIGFGVLLLFIIGVVMSWLSSRGKFMFLDNVVHSRSRVAAPWQEYRNEANSFFLWNLAWGIIFGALGLIYVFYCFLGLQRVYEAGGNSHALILPAIMAGLGLVVFSILGNFIFILLRDFVTLIMYRDRIPTGKALQKFLPLFSSHFLYFIGYGIFLLCLTIGIGIGIVLAGCITCCIGFLILMIPYINAVVLLPISYAMRSFSIEFLEQFGPEFQIFPKLDSNPRPPPDAQPLTV
jgi:hypothetical protein